MKESIRFARPRDIAESVRLSENTNDWRQYWSKPQWRKLLLRDYRRAIRDKCILVATFNRRIIGHILWAEIGTFVYFEEIAIANDFKRKGLGSRLFTRAQEIIGRRGFSHLFVDTYVGNNISLKFSESQGLKICGGIQYLWDDSPYLFLGKEFEPRNNPCPVNSDSLKVTSNFEKEKR